MREISGVLVVILMVAGAAGAGDDDGPKAWLDLSGFYAFNGYSQNNFFLGKGAVGGVSDKDEYSIQLFRLTMDFGYGDNINKIRTNGYFYITEVWEDSVMPDEGGITPQGLGSPASRGYREFENSTLVQLNYSWDINEYLRYYISGTWVQATEAIFEWSDANGDGAIQPDEVGPNSSDDLGTEIDMRLDWKITPGLVWIFRGGIFMPGDGAGYLINGTNAHDDDA